MVPRSRFAACTLAALAGLVLVLPAQAEEFKHRRHHENRHHHHRDHVNPVSINVIPGTGTYSGSITVYHADGVGTSTWAHGVTNALAPEREIVMKIIEVKADESVVSSACSMEEGVCVIRP